MGRRYRTPSKPRDYQTPEAEPLVYWRRQNLQRKTGCRNRCRLRRGNGGSTSGREESELESPSWSPGEKLGSKVGVGNGDRRPEGVRWVHRSEEPLVTRRDPAKSRGTEEAASLDGGEGAQLVDEP